VVKGTVKDANFDLQGNFAFPQMFKRSIHTFAALKE
jgi:hypothetical protein